MAGFIIKRNDTSPAIEYQLQDSSGNAIDISGYTDVRFHMRGSDDTVVIDDNTAGNVSVVNPSEGTVKYVWQAVDTESAGFYEAEWEVEYSDGAIETFPNEDNIAIRIREDIA